jgi:gluconokinase
MWMAALLPASNMTETSCPRLIIIMGVSGCGKSTVAESLADTMNGQFLDADDYHPAANIEKMHRGDALSDNDRWPWLQHFGKSMAQQTGIVVGACSALRQIYRQRLIDAANEAILFVYLNGEKQLIQKRLVSRNNHFMPTSLLDSQFAALEVPDTSEQAISVEISDPCHQVAKQVLFQLKQMYGKQL